MPAPRGEVTCKVAAELVPGARFNIALLRAVLHPLGPLALRLKPEALQPELSLFFTETLYATFVPGETAALFAGESEIDGFAWAHVAELSA